MGKDCINIKEEAWRGGGKEEGGGEGWESHQAGL